jgi:peroxiredoxin
LVQLEEWRGQFEAIGVNVAGMTYDSLEVLADFHAAENLHYPLLRDIDAQLVNALGIRNEEYAQGSQAYGIPHPGILYIDAGGVIRAKYAVPGYRRRPPFDALFEHIKNLVEAQ